MASVRTAERNSAASVDDRASNENFPVALRILPHEYRVALHRIYDVARHIDDLGDVADGDRVELLTHFDADLRRCRTDPAQLPDDPRLRRLAPIVRHHDLPLALFEALVQANLVDQRVSTYETFAELLDYCALSAHPIGRLVLHVFGQANAYRCHLSDRVCAALQVLEHCQDVAEDHAAGRVYLPGDDLRRCGLNAVTMGYPQHREALNSVVLMQVARCRELLTAGPELVGELRGWARIAVTGFVAGGLATVDAIERSAGNVWDDAPHPRRVDLLRHALVLLLSPKSGVRR